MLVLLDASHTAFAKFHRVNLCAYFVRNWNVFGVNIALHLQSPSDSNITILKAWLEPLVAKVASWQHKCSHMWLWTSL